MLSSFDDQPLNPSATCRLLSQLPVDCIDAVSRWYRHLLQHQRIGQESQVWYFDIELGLDGALRCKCRDSHQRPHRPHLVHQPGPGEVQGVEPLRLRRDQHPTGGHRGFRVHVPHEIRQRFQGVVYGEGDGGGGAIRGRERWGCEQGCVDVQEFRVAAEVGDRERHAVPLAGAAGRQLGDAVPHRRGVYRTGSAAAAAGAGAGWVPTSNSSSQRSRRSIRQGPQLEFHHIS